MENDPQNRLARLSSLREEVLALCAVKCQMSHERVIRDADSMLPVVCSFPEGSYQRVGLCNPEVRSQRLACSHTMARIKLERAIDELEMDGAGKSGLRSILAHELNWLNNEIHLLDHRKGEAEKTLARIVEEISGARERTGAGERLRETAQAIREMEQLHGRYVDQIGALRERVVIEMDRLIERYRTESA